MKPDDTPRVCITCASFTGECSYNMKARLACFPGDGRTHINWTPKEFTC